MCSFRPVIRINPFGRRYHLQSDPGNIHLLLTFDAFGTLFKPKSPIASQYTRVAQSLGVTNINEADLKVAFERAYKQESMQNPNFGKATGMTPNEWWTKIIINTFTSITTSPLPPSLAPVLIQHFSSKDAYTLHSDVMPLLQCIKSPPKQWPYATTTIGVITNSDSRVTSILNDLGVGVREYWPTIPGQSQPKDQGVGDKALVDFVAFSYDIGSEKPGRKIFDATRKLWTDRFGKDKLLLSTHVGDDHRKDFRGAMKADWGAILIDREDKRRKWHDEGNGVVGSLEEVVDIVKDAPKPCLR